MNNPAITASPISAAAVAPLHQDLMFGAQAIADALFGEEADEKLRQSKLRQTYYLLECGYLPARKAGGIWIASRTHLLAHFQISPAEVRQQTETLKQTRERKRERAKSEAPQRRRRRAS